MTNYTPTPPVINGLKGCYKQPGTWGRNESGYFWNYVFEGTSAEVEQEAAQCAAAGLKFEVTDLHGRRKKLSYQIGGVAPNGNEQPENVWELDPQDVQKDLLEADFPNSSLAQITKAEKEIISRAVQENTSWESARDSLESETEGIYPDLSASGESLYLLLKAGVRYFPVEASVIRHTQVVSNLWPVKASFSNVGRIISSSSMVSMEDVPSTLLFSVPDEPEITQFIETDGDLQYGWKKSRPRVSRINFSKWQIVQNWQFGLWPVKLFGSVL